MNITELQSKTIDFLRFPLIVGVVFIHNSTSTMIVRGLEIDGNSYMPICDISNRLFSQIIGGLSVPLFFFISGFLFFNNVSFDRKEYRRKMHSRVRTLLIPYLFWNISFLVFYYIVSHLPGLSAWFSGTIYTWDYILSALWGQMNENGTMTFPIAYQFWFIRDLMVIVIMTPLIYWLIRKARNYGVIFIGLLWLWGFAIPYIGIRGFNTAAWFFFMAGAWFSINRKNVIEEFRRIGRWIYLLYIIIVAAYLSVADNAYDEYIGKLSILVGIVCCFKLVDYLLDKKSLKVLPFLSSASFFVFAIHDPWLLSQIRKVLFKIFSPQSDIALTVLYLGLVLIVVAIALILYSLLKRMFPHFTAVITGGR